MNKWKSNLYIIWVTQVISLMSFNFGLPFMSYYIQEMGVNQPADIKMFVGILTSITAVSMGIMSPIWGRLSDKHGKKLMLLRAISVGGVVLIIMGLATNVYQMIFLRFLQGIFTGSVTAASALIASTTPEDHLGYSLGFIATSAPVGAAIGPALGGMVAEWFGYRNSFIIGGSMLIVDALLVFFFVKESKKDSVSNVQKVEDAPATEQPEQKKKFYGVWLLVGMLLVLLTRFSSSVFNPYIPIFVQEKLGTLEGASRITGMVTGFIGIMSALSGFILGRLIDHYERTKLLKIYALLSCLIAVPLYWTGKIWSMALVYGIAMFMLGGIEPLVMSTLSFRVDVNHRGLLFGIQGLISSIGWGLAPLLGSVISINFSVQAILLVIPVFLLMEFLITAFFGKKLVA